MRVAAWEAGLERQRREFAKAGLPALDDKLDALTAAMVDIAGRIYATPAHTVAGLAVKVRLIAWETPAKFRGENPAADAVLAGVERLAGGGA